MTNLILKNIGQVSIGIGLLCLTTFFFFFVIFFRKQLGSFIEKSSFGGRKDPDPSPPQNQISPITELDPKKEADTLLEELDSAIVIEVEKNLYRELQTRHLSDSVEAIPVLVRYCATTFILLDFEKIYRVIYGSQLDLLNYLNTNPPQPLNFVRETFYNPVVPRYPGLYPSYPFDGWLNFLKNAFLVREDDGLVAVTVKGREFLTHLVRSGYAQSKPNFY